MCDELMKEAMDLIAFNDYMNKSTKESILKKVKITHPELYAGWKRDNIHLIDKWNILARLRPLLGLFYYGIN